MNALILATSLWFVSYHAMQGGQDMNVRPLPFGGNAHATRAECVKDGKASVKEFTAHNPLPGTTWKAKCARKQFKVRTLEELDRIHNTHAPTDHGDMDDM